MIGRRRLLLAASVATAVGVLGVRPAHAGCVAPQVSVDGRPVDPYAEPSPAPFPLSRSRELLVTGEWFRDGCEDTVGYSGCSTFPDPPTDPESPQRGVELRLEQAGRSWLLATADAGPRDQRYPIRWAVRLPEGCVDGPAVLVVGSGTEIAVTVVP